MTNAPSVFHYTESLARRSALVTPAVGLHPELAAEREGELGQLEDYVAANRFVGEVGIDGSSSATIGVQRKVFSEILQICDRYPGRIVSVHSRRAAGDVVDRIGSERRSTIILHWFSGSMEALDRAIERGAYFSVNIAMLRSKTGKRIIQRIPRNRVMTESDGPFMRVSDRALEPKDMDLTVRELAGVWGIPERRAIDTVLETYLRIERGTSIG